jgi:hypothetical protein
MTTANEAKEAIYERFLTGFNGVPRERIAFDNEEPKTKGTSWVRLVVRGLGRGQDTLGKKPNRSFQSKASVFVQVYVVANTGVQVSDDLAKEAADLYEGESFSGLDFNEASINEIGPDGKWYQTQVEAEFSYYETK